MEFRMIYLLLCSENFWNGKSRSKHSFCHDKLCGGFPYLQALEVFHSRIRIKRSCADHSLDTGGNKKHIVSLGYNMLLRFSSARYIRFYQLEKNGDQAK